MNSLFRLIVIAQATLIAASFLSPSFSGSIDSQLASNKNHQSQFDFSLQAIESEDNFDDDWDDSKLACSCVKKNLENSKAYLLPGFPARSVIALLPGKSSIRSPPYRD